MLTKAHIIHEIGRAKISHIRWVKRAEHLISGLPVDESFIPLSTATCGFGRWLYSQSGAQLRTLDNFREMIGHIEVLHDHLHEIYREIYKIYFLLPKRRSLFHRMITLNKAHVTKKEKQVAKEYFIALERTSEELLDKLDRFEVLVRQTTSFSELNIA